ncbi:MAG: hypothetical protein L3K06_09135, partial [Thermoplasmata archaeon]|nr:hypothetical protein [Thermoplasmata archaeon]
ALAYDVSGANVSAQASYHWQLRTPANGSLALAPGFRQLYTAGGAAGIDVLEVRASLGGATISTNATIVVTNGSTIGTPGGGAGSSVLDDLGHLPWWVWVGLIVVAAAIAMVLVRRSPPLPPAPEPARSEGTTFIDISGIEVGEPDLDAPPG